MKWLKGLLSAVLGGAANSVTVMIIDPVQFNIFEGWQKLSMVAGVGALLSAAMYIKQSPLVKE